MSPYLIEEASVESGRPIDLYHITSGASEYFYTAAAEDVTVGGDLYTAVAGIARDSFPLGVEERVQDRSFTLPGDNEFVQLFVLSAPSSPSTVEISRVHFGDITDPRLLWEGEVLEIEWLDDAARAKVVCRATSGGLAAELTRYDHGILCPYMLYDSKCTVAEALFKFDGTASAVSGNFLTVSGLDASKTVGWATGGKITSGSEVRMIVEHTATDRLELASPFKDDPNAASVSVFAGCDRTIATCRDKFSNEINHGGNPYVPTDDIYRTGL